MDKLIPYLEKIAQALDRLDPLLPPSKNVPLDFSNHSAFRWRKRNYSAYGSIELIEKPAEIHFSQLVGMDSQLQQIKRNTEQFLADFPANNILLTGARGTGKSSIVKAVLDGYKANGLKMVEIDSQDLGDLPELLTILQAQPFHFIIFCDDLSFEEGDATYKPLKAVLDGSLSAPANNILLYATSNRRHLLPERMQDNKGQYEAQEIHPLEVIEEKISLSERFGLWIHFYPYSQAQYLSVVQSWLKEFSPDLVYNDAIERLALQFSQARGSRSGRIAYQFVKDYVGAQQLENQQTVNSN